MQKKSIKELTYTRDRYDGATINLSSIDSSTNDFAKQLDQLEQSLRNIKLLWINLPIEHSSLIPLLTQRGFSYHQCSASALRLVKKLIHNPILPTAKNFTVGVGAVVIEGSEILVIMNKYFDGYMLPGGHIDNNETIKDALYREVYEETGIKTRFKSIINIGHFTQGQFGEANLYIVCSAEALTKEIDIHDSSEIIEARWMPISEYLESKETNVYNRAIVTAAMTKTSQLTDKKITLKIPCRYEVFL